MDAKKIRRPFNRAILDKLLRAVKTSDIVQVESHLTQPLDVNTLDNSKKTPLFHAICSNEPRIIETLILHGADVNQPCYVAYHRENQLYCCVEPPIVTAARTGNVQAVKYLLSAGAYIDAQGEFRKPDDAICKDMSALHFACEDSRVDMVELLLSNHAEVNLEDKGQETALHKTVRCSKSCEKQCRIVQLLCEHGSDVNHIDKLQTSPLYLATFYGCLKKMEILLLYGADVNKLCGRESSYGTPLHIAAARDQVPMAQLLILHGAKLSICNGLDCTPLHLNVNSMIKSSIAQHLIYHGASVDGIDKWEYTLLGACVRNMRIDCESLCKLLVFSGCDLNKEEWLKPRDPKDLEDIDDNHRIPIASGRMEKLCNWLSEQQTNPLCLSSLTRIAIRSHFRKLTDDRSIVASVQALPLPPALKDLVLLGDYIDLTVSPSNTKVFGKHL